LHHPFHALAGQSTVLADPLDVQKTPVDVATQRLQVVKIAETLPHPEIFRIVEGAFGAKGSPLFEVLLELELLVFDVEAGMSAPLDHARAKTTRRLVGDLPVKEQLHPVRTTEVHIVPDHLVGKIVLAVVVLELDEGNPLAAVEVLDGSREALRHLTQQHRRGDRLTQMVAHKPHERTTRLKLGT